MSDSARAEVISDAKRVYVTCTGPRGKPQRPLVEVQTGSTPADLLAQLGFSTEEHDLVIKNGPLLDTEADLYNTIDAKTELQVVPKMEQGIEQGASSEAPFLTRLLRHFQHEKVVRVEHAVRPFWQERGWVEVSPGVFRGSYRTPFRSFQGEIMQQDALIIVCIAERPPEVAYHPHGSCLWAHGKSFQLHYTRKPDSVNSAIVDMERFLTESFRRARTARRAS